MIFWNYCFLSSPQKTTAILLRHPFSLETCFVGYISYVLTSIAIQLHRFHNDLAVCLMVGNVGVILSKYSVKM